MIDLDEWDMFDEYDDEPRTTTCKLCGSTDVYWEFNQQLGKWQLRGYNRFAGKLHVCKPTARAEHLTDAFDDES